MLKREDGNSLDKRTGNVHGDVICCVMPPPNLNFVNIFNAGFGDKPPNLKTANISGYMVGILLRHKLDVFLFHPE